MTSRIAEYLEQFARLAGLRFRCVLERDGGTSVVHDSLGHTVDTDVTEQTWRLLPSVSVRVSLGLHDRSQERILLPLLRESLGRLLASEQDAKFFSDELSDRYEEIALLTSISETLGSIIHLERAAGRLLGQVVEVMEADFAALWVPDASESELRLFAAGGSEQAEPPRVSLRDGESPLAEVYGSQSTLLREAVPAADGEPVRRTFLAVPVRHSALHGQSRSVGVLGIRGCGDRPSFSQGDAKLAGAIASHLAAAIENGRLVRETLEQERLLVELELAHHLQLKLLPELADFAGLADVAARCEPAESVGGDFYHFFKLPGERLGVMLGDVSSHGYSAGLIMALTMSAASIVVQDREQPAEVLKGIHRELVRKLESTEMYMTLCYAVIDPRLSLLRYANAGHPHAYLIGPAGSVRLEALNPPLGIAEFDSYSQRDMEWIQGRDTLLMFTDGISECLRTDQLWSDEQLTAIARESSGAASREVLDRVFELASAPGGIAADDRTALVVK
jgi:sigma-B regulation protein RsbU (phosphoserine phosphatase)